MKRSGLALALAAALGGCTQLPDLQLAKRAQTGGDLATAEANFRPLAEQGFVEAQIGLADVLVQSPEAQRQAQGEALYRQAAEVSPLARSKLGKWLAAKEQASVAEQQEAERLLLQAIEDGDQSALLALLRLQLQDPQRLASGEIEAQLRGWQARGMPQARLGWILLYRARGDYAAHLAEIRQGCEAWLSEVSECYVELVSVYRLEGAQEPLQALLERLRADYAAGLVTPIRVKTVAAALVAEGQGAPQPELAREIYAEIAPQWPDAWVSLADLLRRFPQLGDGQQAVAYLEQGLAAGSSKAALSLGHLYLNGQLVPAEPRKAEQYLLQAAAEENKAHMLLGKLYRGGQLGRIDPQKALDHLLLAARAGEPGADAALAQLFGEGRGIRINPVYAYGFALLAKEQGSAQGDVWLERMAPRLQPADLQRAREMAAKERAARAGERISQGNHKDKAQEVL
ncbi:alginate biosynthesis protein AlgK [Pseudomonas alcaligenes]|uniref:tetratricopeptide repeat protein n=1 Tax=Aquipseudomonas alcaligenes TaxID=43263 RepID=UPI002E7B1220|nr:alginate biosynthesis protein AlgK [Pseudomonas alcaligenes]MEE1949304.1 alginate biosynthesis protein AlgK [Pseudomonas alcaligenes]